MTTRGIEINSYVFKKMLLLITFLILILNIQLTSSNYGMVFHTSNPRTLLNNSQTRNNLSRNFVIDLKSGWSNPPDYTPIPEPEKKISIDPDGDNEVNFNFTVYNLGENATIGFNVTLPINWTFDKIQDIYLENGTNSTIDLLNLRVFPSLNREDLPTLKLLVINLTAYVKNSTDVKVTITFYVRIGTYWPYPLLFPPKNTTVKPKIAIIDCSIINDGNGEDNFEIYTALGRTEAERVDLESRGWEANIHSGTITQILKRGEDQIFQVLLKIPQNEEVNDLIPINIKVKSIRKPHHQDGIKDLIFNVSVGIYNSVEFYIEEPNIEYNETPKWVNLIVKNTGNFLNDDFELLITSQPDNWTIEIDNKNLSANGIQVAAIVQIGLKIIAPDLVLEGWYKINLTARSFGDHGGGIDSENNLTLNIYIPIHSNITVEFLEQLKVGRPGDQISCAIRLRNLGNSPDRVDLGYSIYIGVGYYFELKINSTIRDIEPFGFIDLQLNISIDIDTPADPIPETESLENYAVKITAVTWKNTEYQAQIILEFKVLPIYNFSIFSPLKYIRIIRHLDMISEIYDNYRFEIDNNGNYIDSISLSIEGPDWIRLNNSLINLSYPGYKTSNEFNLVLDFKTLPEVNNYKINITGVSINNRSIMDIFEIWVIIADYDINIPTLKINGKSKSETVSEIGKEQNIFFSLKRNQSFNYISPEPWQVQVTIYSISGNGSFFTIEMFNISDKSINMKIDYSFNYTFNEIGLFIILVKAELINGTNLDESNVENNKNFVTIKIVHSLTEGEEKITVTFEYFIILSVILILILLISVLLFIERTRYSVLKLGLGRKNIKMTIVNDAGQNKFSENYSSTKNRIFTYIRLNPGVNYTELKFQNSISNTELIQYLETLKADKSIISKFEGTHIIFYPSFTQVEELKSK